MMQVRKSGGMSKGGKINPFLSWTSTFEERQASDKVVLNRNRSTITVKVEDWLGLLRSQYTPGYGSQKSPSVRRRDLRTYEKFWRIANGRGVLKQLFEDPSLNENQIAKRMQDEGFNISHAQVELIRKSWYPNRETRRTKVVHQRDKVLAAVAAHPRETWDAIGKRAGVSPYVAALITKNAGVKKPSSRSISSEERSAREKFLRDADIEFPSHELPVSVEKMKSRCLHMLETYGYVVRHYDPFLGLTSEKVDATIRVLDSYGIDWRDYDKELWRLIRNSPGYFNDKMVLFMEIGASSELHYLLVKKLSGRLEHYSSDRKVYPALRTAVVEGDTTTLLAHVPSIVSNTLRLKEYLGNDAYFDAGRDATIFVLSQCSSPQNNPAAFLSLMAAAIEVAIDTRVKETLQTDSLEEYIEPGSRIRRARV